MERYSAELIFYNDYTGTEQVFEFTKKGLDQLCCFLKIDLQELFEKDEKEKQEKLLKQYETFSKNKR